MRKLSDIIKENESNKEFKYSATVKVEGTVIAASEGEAGELVDKEMDTIPGMINYEIDNIASANGVDEKKINESSHITTIIEELKNHGIFVSWASNIAKAIKNLNAETDQSIDNNTFEAIMTSCNQHLLEAFKENYNSLIK